MQKMEGINHWLEVLKKKAPSGYAIGLHVEYNTPKLMFETYPVAWVNCYEKNGYFLNDPVVMWGFQNTGICRWSDLASIDAKGVLIAAKAFDLNFGFAVSINMVGKLSIAGFSRPDREFTDAEMEEITEILELIHKEEVSSIKLTEKQKALLNALANGARNEEASEMLGIPLVTVKAQLTKVRTLLGTRTTAEAIQRAADLGLL